MMMAIHNRVIKDFDFGVFISQCIYEWMLALVSLLGNDARERSSEVHFLY